MTESGARRAIQTALDLDIYRKIDKEKSTIIIQLQTSNMLLERKVIEVQNSCREDISVYRISAASLTKQVEVLEKKVKRRGKVIKWSVGVNLALSGLAYLILK